MIHQYVKPFSGRVLSATAPLAILAFWATAGASLSLAQQSPQPTYSSAAEASQALFKAVQHNDSTAIVNILGGSSELASCQDETQDKLDRARFVEKFHEMQRLKRETDGSVTLYIGAENWPFPIPLVEKNGAWHFDQETGQKEVLYRRIGENELAAIAICRDFASENQVNNSPVDTVAKAIRESDGGDPVLFRGYYFQVLTMRPSPAGRKGHFTLIAYPAEYRTSGVMTFVITGSDVVYEKDLGAKTATIVKAMARFQKDATWHASRY